MLPGKSTNSKRSGNASAGPSDASNAFVIVFDSKQYEKKTPKKSRSRRTGAAELTFINTTGSDKYAPSARQLIRTHVMSDYWRKQLKGHRSKPDVQDSSQMQYPAGLLAHLPPLGSQPLGGPDPFSRFPVEMQPYMYSLLDLYASDIVHKLCPKTKEHERHLPQCPRSIWLQRDLADAATLRALLCAAALYVDEVSGQGFSPMRYILKKDALRTISDRLSNSESVADGTITAVAYLAIEEGVALNLSTWASHMTGLQQMIELRGGMSKLDKRVQGVTHFANLHGCDGTSVMLYFPWVTESSNQQHITYPLLLPELETDSRWDAAIEGFDTQLLATFIVIKNLTTVMNQAAESNMGVDQLVAKAALFLMETRLLLSSVAEGEPEQKFINESCSLGIQIYLSTIFAETSDMEVAKIDLSNPISALRRHLSDIDIRTMPCPHLLIWVIFFGGMNSRDYKDRSWFAVRLREAAQFWNIYNWDSLRLTFKSFLWIDRRHDEQGLQFWSTAVVEY